MENPYERLYLLKRVPCSPTTSLGQAESMAIQLSFIYNTFGLALKDMISLVGKLYSRSEVSADLAQAPEPKQPISRPPKLQSKLIAPIRPKAGKCQQKKQATQAPRQQTVSFYKLADDLGNEEERRVHIKEVKPVQIKEVKPIQIKEAKPAENQYVRVGPTRNKKERALLNGYPCLNCEKFYKCLQEDFKDKNGRNKLCHDCSRHRSNLPPTNYFSGFSQQFGWDD